MLLTACASQGAGQSAIAVAPPDAGQSESESDAAASPEVSKEAPCAISERWLQPHKMCSTDSDCRTVIYRPTCCPTQQIVGVAATDVDQVQACADAAPPVCTKNGSCTGMQARAEDGRAVQSDFHNVAVSCIDNICEAKVTTRTCGTSSCQADEACIAYQNVPGSAPSGGTGNALLIYACVKNTCKQQLDCSCAQAMCDVRSDALRQCAVKLTDAAEADVVCSPVHA